MCIVSQVQKSVLFFVETLLCYGAQTVGAALGENSKFQRAKTQKRSQHQVNTRCTSQTSSQTKNIRAFSLALKPTKAKVQSRLRNVEAGSMSIFQSKIALSNCCLSCFETYLVETPP